MDVRLCDGRKGMSLRRLFGCMLLVGCFVALGCAPKPSADGVDFCQTNADCQSQLTCWIGVCVDRSILEGRGQSTLDGGEAIREREPSETLPESKLPDCTPSAEICNGKDDDCDGQIDEDYPNKGTECVVSGEKGPCAQGTLLCQQGVSKCVSAHQKVAEICGNGIDEDCDGLADGPPCKCTPGDKQDCYTGPVGTDRKGLCKKGEQLCKADSSWGDCTGEIVPTTELCNGKDDNCDGQIDEAYPENGQSCTANGQQGECAKGTYTCASGTLTCQAASSSKEICDGKDNDCDGKVDNNVESIGKSCSIQGQQGRCAEGTYTNCQAAQLECTTSYQPQSETCNGQDDDCDGQTDETFAKMGMTCVVSGTSGPCAAGTYTCTQGKEECTSSYTASAELCGDGVDNDCDGTVDEAQCTCKPGNTRNCYAGPAGTLGVGACQAGTQTCDSAGKWGSCVGEVLPTKEQCNSKDDDCDGQVDEGYIEVNGSTTCTPVLAGTPRCTKGYNVCESGTLTCAQPKTSVLIPGAYQGFSEGFVGSCKPALFEQPFGLAFNAKGELFVSDFQEHVIRKIDLAGNVTTFVGKAGSSGRGNGQGKAARFNAPAGLAIDDKDNLYVADQSNHRIRKIDPQGNVTTFAGSSSGYKDGKGTAARFNAPTGLVYDKVKHVLYVADRGNHRIRAIDVQGNVSTFAGTKSGKKDGQAALAEFNSPQDVVINSKGELFVSDRDNHQIRKIDAQGNVTTFAGTTSGNKDGPGNAAQFDRPMYMAVGAGDELYVSEENTHVVRKLTSTGVVSTHTGARYSRGATNSTLFFGRVIDPRGMAFAPDGALMLADAGNHLIRRLTSTEIRTYAGRTTAGDDDGKRMCARMYSPRRVRLDPTGTLYVLDVREHVIAKVDQNGYMSVVAGSGESGGRDGDALSAQFDEPVDVVWDSKGNMFIADLSNELVRKLDTNGKVSTFAGSYRSLGKRDGVGTSAQFDSPYGLAIDKKDALFVADTDNNRIRKIDPSANVTTYTGANRAYKDGTLAQARFVRPISLTFDTIGNLFVVEFNGNRIRKIDTSGNVTTLIGSTSGTSGKVDGIGTAARLYYVWDLAFGPMGRLFFLGEGNDALRVVDTTANTTTLVGEMGSSDSTDGTYSQARFDNPKGIAVDANGNMYVADEGNRSVRFVPVCPP